MSDLEGGISNLEIYDSDSDGVSLLEFSQAVNNGDLQTVKKYIDKDLIYV